MSSIPDELPKPCATLSPRADLIKAFDLPGGPIYAEIKPAHLCSHFYTLCAMCQPDWEKNFVVTLPEPDDG